MLRSLLAKSERSNKIDVRLECLKKTFGLLTNADTLRQYAISEYPLHECIRRIRAGEELPFQPMAIKSQPREAPAAPKRTASKKPKLLIAKPAPASSSSSNDDVPTDWTQTNARCHNPGKCSDTACAGHIQAERLDVQFKKQFLRADITPDSSQHVDFFKNHRIALTGRMVNTTKAEVRDRCLVAGAASVRKNSKGALGNATMVIMGPGHSESIVEEAKKKKVVILTQAEAMRQLTPSSDTSNQPNADTFDEQGLATQLIDELAKSGGFQPQEGLNQDRRKLCDVEGCLTWARFTSDCCYRHETEYQGVVPPSLSRAYPVYETDLVYQEAVHDFTDPQFVAGRKRDGPMRQLRFTVKRVKRKGPGSKFVYEFSFGTRKKAGKDDDGVQLYQYDRFCLAHDAKTQDCRFCNKCNHVDEARGIGFSFPHTQCIQCSPNIACVVCGLEPRIVDQEKCKLKNHCERCHRQASGNERSEDINLQAILDAGIPVQSANRKVFRDVNSRPDAFITASSLSTVIWENDEGNGHCHLTNYPAKDEHERMVAINLRLRETDVHKAAVWIRQNPATIYRSAQQSAQNAIVVRLIKHYMVTDLGRPKFGKGGKKIIVFVGYPRNNPHLLKALEEKANGYWNGVVLVGCR